MNDLSVLDKALKRFEVESAISIDGLPAAASGAETPAAGGTSQSADFELSKICDGSWRLRVLTLRGKAWAVGNTELGQNDDWTLSLLAANSFLTRARVQGLTTEYLGPFGKSLM